MKRFFTQCAATIAMLLCSATMSAQVSYEDWTSTNQGEDNSTSSFDFLFDVHAGNVLTFDWEVSSEQGCDVLRIYLNGTKVLEKSGVQAGSFQYQFISDGQYTLTAEYTKDGSVHTNGDYAKVSNIFVGVASGSHDNLTWRLSADGKLRITGNGPMKEEDSGSNYPWYEHRDKIQSIAIGEGVTSIGSQAFGWYGPLSSVTIPSSVETIGSYAFCNCNNLTSVDIPEGVTSIGYQAFAFCYGLNSITIPSSVVSMDHSFQHCSVLNSIIVADDNATYDSRENCNAIIETGSNTLIQGCSATLIPESVTSIGNCAFQGCSSLTSITIPESVTSIGSYAFYGCSLTTITIPESVTSIGSYAFEYCYGLESIAIPESLTSIERGAFAYCYGLTAIIVDENNPVYDSRENCNAIIETSSNTLIQGCSATLIPESVTSIGSYAFYGCSLTTITIPESVTSIGSYAFADCDGLTAITLPESVTSIGDDAFAWCSSLTAITLPESVTSIRNYAFAYCDGLTAITFTAANPPAIESYVFEGTNKDISLYVLDSSLAAYQAAEYWNEFNIRGLATGIPTDAYLLNVGTGKFLTAANDWGTQATLGDRGVDVTLTQLPNGRYTIDSHIFNNQTDHYLGNILYMDAPAAEWIIEAQGEGYTLSLNGEQYIGFVDTTTVVGLLEDSTNLNAQWILVTRDELFATLEGATKETPVDATFLISGADLSRNDSRNLAWQGDPTYGGQYYNMCAEKWNTTFDVYQDLSGLPNGYYKVTVQGFYRDGSSASENAERHAIFYAGDAETPLMSIMGENLDVYPNSMVDASERFTEGLYADNVLMAEVTDGTLRIGIKKDVYISGDWAIFDNFELYYMGTLAHIYDSRSNFVNIGANTFETLIYTRTFTDTEWQPLYVPFEMAYEDFSDDFEVAYLNNVCQYDRNDDGVKDETVIEAFKVKEGVLEANYPYLIRAKETGEKNIMLTNATVYDTEVISVDCASIFDTYTFTGTYSELYSEDLPQGQGYFTLHNGEWLPVAEDASLGAFRFYLQIEPRRGSNANSAAYASSIRMRVVDENSEEGDVTSIEESEMKNEKSGIIYDLSGRRVESPAKGVYIVNGRKVVIK